MDEVANGQSPIHDVTKRVRDYYDSSPETEWRRLERHRIEFALTMRVLQEHLPPAPARILDIGSGPGRYALALAQAGYQVTLLDLSQGNLSYAQQKAREQEVTLQEYVHGDALDLSRFEEESFDAVILMGPLYHLLTLEQRFQAVSQARRVVKRGGPLFAAFITRYAALRDIATRNPLNLLEDLEGWKTYLQTGVVIQDGTEGFIDAYFAHPTEIEPLMSSVGLTGIDLVACEGIVGAMDHQINLLTGEDWQAWVEINYQLSHDRTIHGSAPHLLYIGRK